MKLFGLGLVLTAVVTGVLWATWGRTAILPGVCLGLVATAIQLAARAVVMPARSASLDKFVGRWALGMGLRFAGVVLVAIAVVADRALFPPGPTAFGFLGVLVPLLFLELRQFR